jgi:Domain of unknown function (DUF5134)
MTMGGPAWLSGILAVLVLAIAAYCLGRLVVSAAQDRPTDVDVDVVHGAMGVGMAAMLEPSLSPVPNVTWAWVFAVAAAWLVWRIVRVYQGAGSRRIAQAHYVPHLVMAVAMIYMGVAGSAGSGSAGGGMAMGGSGAGASHFPAVALILALFMFGYAVWLTDQLPAIAPVRVWRAAPQLALAGAGASVAGLGRVPEPGPSAAAPVVRAAVAAHAAAAAAELAPQAGEDSSPGDDARQRGVPLSPRLEAGCHIAMAVVMGYMLILMV